MKTADFIIIHGEKRITDFMKAADLFQGTNFGFREEITIEYKDKAPLDMEYAKKGITTLKDAFEKLGHIVSFVHLVQVRVNDNITLNSKIKPYFDPKARQISDGKKFFILKDYIELTTPFTCKTDDKYYITEIIE